jgi:PAS domain S-box-containing protein
MEKFLYLLPYLASLGLSLGILYYTWRHRSVRGAAIYAGYMMAQTLWSFGFIMELVSNSLNWKIVWDAVQWIAGVWVILTIPPFVVSYIGYSVKRPKLVWGLSFVIPGIFLIILSMDGWLHLIYPDPHLVTGAVFSELDYHFSAIVVAFGIYSYLISLFSIGLLLRRVFRPQRLYRTQIIIVTIGFLIPLVGNMLTLAGIRFTPERDPSPFTFAVGNLMITYGLFRYRLFDVVPVARDIVFESIPDFVLVIDNQNRIVDVNPATLDWLKATESQLIGHSVGEISRRWPEMGGKFHDAGAEKQKDEFTLHGQHGEEIIFQVEVSPIIDWRKRLVGRVFIGREITESKKLELLLRNMARELEERVHERTRDLAEAYDTTLEGWARTLELRDKETEGHSRSVTELTFRLATLMNVPQEELVHIRRGALLHDIGKMGIPDEILRKPGPLTPEEWKIVEGHPEIARRLLAPIAFLHRALEIPYFHHERWDGSGYPNGLKGDNIPLSARIFAVADVWDAMRSERPYHGAYSEEEALTYIQEQSGKFFDPNVVAGFLKLYHQGWMRRNVGKFKKAN